jgi:hypothetical protein
METTGIRGTLNYVLVYLFNNKKFCGWVCFIRDVHCHKSKGQDKCTGFRDISDGSLTFYGSLTVAGWTTREMLAN